MQGTQSQHTKEYFPNIYFQKKIFIAGCQNFIRLGTCPHVPSLHNLCPRLRLVSCSQETRRRQTSGPNKTTENLFNKTGFYKLSFNKFSDDKNWQDACAFLLYNSCTILSKLYAPFDAINIVCIFGKKGAFFY